VVALNREKGLLVSRLIRFDHTDVLVSDPSGVRVGLTSCRIALARGRQGALVDRASTMIFFNDLSSAFPRILQK
jgi:hypothetical protein